MRAGYSTKTKGAGSAEGGSRVDCNVFRSFIAQKVEKEQIPIILLFQLAKPAQVILPLIMTILTVLGLMEHCLFVALRVGNLKETKGA